MSYLTCSERRLRKFASHESMESTTAPRVKSCAHPYDRIVQSVDRHDSVSETRLYTAATRRYPINVFQHSILQLSFSCFVSSCMHGTERVTSEKKITRTVMNPVNPTAFMALIVVTYQVACKNLIPPTETDVCCQFGALLRRDVIGATMS